MSESPWLSIGERALSDAGVESPIPSEVTDALNDVKEHVDSDPCKEGYAIVKGIVSGIIGTMSVGLAIPAYLLMRTIGNLLSCPAGREQIADGIFLCLEAHAGGIGDAAIGIYPRGVTSHLELPYSEYRRTRRRSLYKFFWPTEYGMWISHDTAEATARRKNFARAYVEGRSVDWSPTIAMGAAIQETGTQALRRWSADTYPEANPGRQQKAEWQKRKLSDKSYMTERASRERKAILDGRKGQHTGGIKEEGEKAPGGEALQTIAESCFEGAAVQAAKQLDPKEFAKFEDQVNPIYAKPGKRVVKKGFSFFPLMVAGAGVVTLGIAASRRKR